MENKTIFVKTDVKNLPERRGIYYHTICKGVNKHQLLHLKEDGKFYENHYDGSAPTPLIVTHWLKEVHDFIFETGKE